MIDPVDPRSLDAAGPIFIDDDPGRTSHGVELHRSIGQQLSDMARELQAEADFQHTLDAIVHAAVVNIPGATAAGIMLVDRKGAARTVAATDDIVEKADQAQYRTGEGPCLQSLREHETVRSDDLRTDARWPHFGAAVVELGVLSALCIQMFVRDEDMGALNLYADRPSAFDNADEEIGLLLASHAAVAMVGAQEQRNLRLALASRDVIGQAKGILMERHKVTSTQAFALLSRVSQATNRKLYDLAEELAVTGVEPTETYPTAHKMRVLGRDSLDHQPGKSTLGRLGGSARPSR